MNTNDASISLEGLSLLSYPCYTLDLFGVRFVPPQETIVWGNNLRVLGLLLNIMYTGLSSPTGDYLAVRQEVTICSI